MEALGGGTEVDIKAIIGVQTCLGGGSCNQSQNLNAIGDLFDVDLSSAAFNDLGTVGKTDVKALRIPSKVGSKTLYKFTTQDGKVVYLGLEMKPAPMLGRRFNKLGNLTAGRDFNIVELYRYDASKDEWLRNNVIFVQAGKEAAIPATISPNGELIVDQFAAA